MQGGGIMIKEEKEQLKVYVSKNLIKQLKELVVAKYGKLRGGLSYEVEDALKNWIMAHSTQHDTKIVQSINPMPRVFQVFNQVKEQLKTTYGYLPQQTTIQHLTRAISIVRGGDKRTIRKWLQEFAKWKLIKEIAPGIFEVV
jgi:hypothetical protein